MKACWPWPRAVPRQQSLDGAAGVTTSFGTASTSLECTLLGSPTQLCPSLACCRPSTRTASPAALLELNPRKKRNTRLSASRLWDREEEREVEVAKTAAWGEARRVMLAWGALAGALGKGTRAGGRDPGQGQGTPMPPVRTGDRTPARQHRFENWGPSVRPSTSPSGSEWSCPPGCGTLAPRAHRPLPLEGLCLCSAPTPEGLAAGLGEQALCGKSGAGKTRGSTDLLPKDGARGPAWGGPDAAEAGPGLGHRSGASGSGEPQAGRRAALDSHPNLELENKLQASPEGARRTHPWHQLLEKVQRWILSSVSGCRQAGGRGQGRPPVPSLSRKLPGAGRPVVRRSHQTLRAVGTQLSPPPLPKDCVYLHRCVCGFPVCLGYLLPGPKRNPGQPRPRPTPGPKKISQR